MESRAVLPPGRVIVGWVTTPADDDLDGSHLPLCDDHDLDATLISLAAVACGRCGRSTAISFINCTWCCLELKVCAFDGKPMTRVGKPPPSSGQGEG